MKNFIQKNIYLELMLNNFKTLLNKNKNNQIKNKKNFVRIL